MHRSSSHIGSLQDYKPKKLWKSIVSKDISSPSSPTSPTSSMSLSRTLSRSSTMGNIKRNSTIISEPSQLRSSQTSKRLSSYNMLNNCDLEIDPKERDFHSKVKNNRHTSIYLPNYTDNDNYDDDDDSESLHFVNMDINNKDTAANNNNNNTQESDTLSSALEDYKIFTKKATTSPSSSSTATPTKPDFSESTTQVSRLSSLPSFSSTTTIDSQISVLHVSNSLWIGSTISDIDEEESGFLSEKNSSMESIDHFQDFDYENVFDYSDDVENFDRGCRTSLIFV